MAFGRHSFGAILTKIIILKYKNVRNVCRDVFGGLAVCEPRSALAAPPETARSTVSPKLQNYKNQKPETRKQKTRNQKTRNRTVHGPPKLQNYKNQSDPALRRKHEGSRASTGCHPAP